jgi:hypothetical protein
MAEFIFDGKGLRKRSGQREGELKDNVVVSWNGSKVGKIEGRNILDPGGKKLAEFDGKNVVDDKGKKIATIEDVRKLVDGEAGISMIALWYFFIWK